MTATTSKLEKLTIIAFSKPNYTGQVGEPFKVYLNPKPYKRGHTITYNECKPAGSSGANIRFSGMEAESISFEFVFDATGVVPGSTTDLEGQITAFKEVVYSFNGDIHSPNYLKLSWGKLLFKGRLTKLDIEYTFFQPNGTPLRATVKADFKEFTDAKTIALEENKSSPDLTHIRIVKDGDTLPLMCYRIYGDSTYYLEVARHNNMDTFTDITPGMKIYFPPLKK
jgi:nucleoid-associated protein YgaU